MGTRRDHGGDFGDVVSPTQGRRTGSSRRQSRATVTAFCWSGLALGSTAILVSALLGCGAAQVVGGGGEGKTGAPAPPGGVTSLTRSPRAVAFDRNKPVRGGSSVVAKNQTSMLLLGNETGWVKVASNTFCQSQWDGELALGEAIYGGTAGGDANGAVELLSGELYIESQAIQELRSDASTNPLAYPIVVTRGGVEAGSIGTSWFVWATNPTTTYFVLLGSTDGAASGSAAGPLYVGTCTDCMSTSPTACCQKLVATDTYIKTVSSTSGSATTISAPKLLYPSPNDPSHAEAATLATKVAASKTRAKASGLRP